jgi:hypothetical protein
MGEQIFSGLESFQSDPCPSKITLIPSLVEAFYYIIEHLYIRS